MGSKKRERLDISFAGILGNSSTVKIIEYLIIGRNFKYHMTDIARGAKVSRALCHKIMKELESKKIVKQVDKIGNMPLYQINKKSKIVFYLIKTFNATLNKKKLNLN